MLSTDSLASVRRRLSIALIWTTGDTVIGIESPKTCPKTPRQGLSIQWIVVLFPQEILPFEDSCSGKGSTRPPWHPRGSTRECTRSPVVA